MMKLFTTSRSSLARIPSVARFISRPTVAATSFSTNTTTTTNDNINNTNDPPPSNKPHDPIQNRQRALSLYRQLLRGAERMPTPNRQNYIKRKTRDEYKRHKTLMDQDEIDFQLRLADTNLDTVLVQAEHLSRLFSDPEYQNYN